MILKNVKAVITGAGSGLGEGTARYLKEKGAELLFCLLYTSPSPRDS